MIPIQPFFIGFLSSHITSNKEQFKQVPEEPFATRKPKNTLKCYSTSLITVKIEVTVLHGLHLNITFKFSHPFPIGFMTNGRTERIGGPGFIWTFRSMPIKKTELPYFKCFKNAIRNPNCFSCLYTLLMFVCCYFLT